MNKKKALETIANCKLCSGIGYEGWAHGEDFDIEWCDCNPEQLTPELGYTYPERDTCIGCNENGVSWDELYCYTCYLANNAEIDYTQIDQLFITQEAN
jgi:hypothetical protein